MSSGGIPLILDVDTGIDDALAILLACASPECELIAVTCVSGNAALEDTQRNTRAVLELAGRRDVEVSAGRPTPLLRPLEITPETHGPRGIGYAELPEPSVPPSTRFGPDLIVEEARRRPGELTLVTLGPLTNLAVAVRTEPALPRLLRRWICMGGAFRVPGNTTPVSEWNIHCDPDAARIAFGAWQAAIDTDEVVPRALVMGLDVTEQARITLDEVVAVGRRAGVSAAPTGSWPGSGTTEPGATPGNPVMTFVSDALRWYFEFHERSDGFYGAFVHDPLVVAAALDPGIVRAEPVAVQVAAEGGVADGQTIADWRGLWGRTPNADVAVWVDAGEFRHRLVERVGGLAASRAMS
jgi:purine nucleosidase